MPDKWEDCFTDLSNIDRKGIIWTHTEQAKSFIRSLLAEERKNIAERLEKCESYDEETGGYYSMIGIDNLIQELRGEK